MPIFVNIDEWQTKKLPVYFPAYECKDCHKIYMSGECCPRCKSENKREMFTTSDKLLED